MVRDVLYAYSIDEKIRAYTYAVVFYFSVRMHRRNAVRAVGSARVTFINTVFPAIEARGLHSNDAVAAGMC